MDLFENLQLLKESKNKKMQFENSLLNTVQNVMNKVYLPTLESEDDNKWVYWKMPKEGYNGPFIYPHYSKEYNDTLVGYVYPPYKSNNPKINNIDKYKAELTDDEDVIESKSFNDIDSAKQWLDKIVNKKSINESKNTNISVDNYFDKLVNKVQDIFNCDIDDTYYDIDNYPSEFKARFVVYNIGVNKADNIEKLIIKEISDDYSDVKVDYEFDNNYLDDFVKDAYVYTIQAYNDSVDSWDF